MKNSDFSTVTAIILAAGSSSRLGGDTTKQRIKIFGESVLYRSVKVFSNCDFVDSIIIVSKADEIDWARAETASFNKVINVVAGGKTRAESARIGFSVVPKMTKFVAIHDCARCLVTEANIRDVADMAFIHGAATACCAVTDTLKSISGDGFITNTISRSGLFSAQTPQIFAYSLYAEALENCTSDECITDDNMLIESMGGRVYPVDIGRSNIKITTADDLAYAEYIIDRRRSMNEIRIGHGYDVHRLIEGRRLVLGGVDIPHEKGLLGHSDADVLVHAIMDAILGACCLGDIGRHFPDNDSSYNDISSLLLLEKVKELIADNGYSIVNIDATIILQKPKVSPYIDKMVENISLILGLDQGRINIKATTEEYLGFTGREEGVSAHAVALVKK